MTPKETGTRDTGRTTVAVATAGLVVVALLAAGPQFVDLFRYFANR